VTLLASWAPAICIAPPAGSGPTAHAAGAHRAGRAHRNRYHSCRATGVLPPHPEIRAAASQSRERVRRHARSPNYRGVRDPACLRRIAGCPASGGRARRN
jgi:hypothetical protein